MQDFAAIDFETANYARSSVCSVGVIIVRGGEVVDFVEYKTECITSIKEKSECKTLLQ